jgi:cell division protein FtsX
MSDIKLVDITIHIDKETDEATRSKIESALRGIDGVVSVHLPQNETHLVVVEYNPDATSSSVLLASVREMAGHAEMIGL